MYKTWHAYRLFQVKCTLNIFSIFLYLNVRLQSCHNTNIYLHLTVHDWTFHFCHSARTSIYGLACAVFCTLISTLPDWYLKIYRHLMSSFLNLCCCVKPLYPTTPLVLFNLYWVFITKYHPSACLWFVLYEIHQNMSTISLSSIDVLTLRK